MSWKLTVSNFHSCDATIFSTGWELFDMKNIRRQFVMNLKIRFIGYWFFSYLFPQLINYFTCEKSIENECGLGTHSSPVLPYAFQNTYTSFTSNHWKVNLIWPQQLLIRNYSYTLLLSDYKYFIVGFTQADAYTRSLVKHTTADLSWDKWKLNSFNHSFTVYTFYESYPADNRHDRCKHKSRQYIVFTIIPITWILNKMRLRKAPWGRPLSTNRGLCDCLLDL